MIDNTAISWTIIDGEVYVSMNDIINKVYILSESIVEVAEAANSPELAKHALGFIEFGKSLEDVHTKFRKERGLE